MAKKVLISGCYDLLHSGHVQFFKEASQYGDLYVSVASDEAIKQLKDRTPVNNESERLFMVKSIRYVKEAFVSRGLGILNFIDDLDRIKPDYFIVNEDGNTPNKEEVMVKRGIKYLVLKRTPADGLKPRFSTDLRKLIKIPYRIDLAGGWLDQPFVSKHNPGPVITFPIFGVPHKIKKEPLQLENIIEFNTRSGMATSTRNTAIKLWGQQLDPRHHPYKLAEILFAHENPPGKTEISGAQDAIGITVPGITRSDYRGEYWPHNIETIEEKKIIDWLEDHLSLIPLNPRPAGFEVLRETKISPEGARALSSAAEKVWQALHELDLAILGEGVRESFEAQIAMFPAMVDEGILKFIDQTKNKHSKNFLGYKLSGAGGGGYLICVTHEPIPDSIGVKIIREIISD